MNRPDFTIVNDADELRVDERCRELLQRFHRHLLDAGIPPAEAGELAHGADYYLRDFLVSAGAPTSSRKSRGTSGASPPPGTSSTPWSRTAPS
jgi:hypothetical protein